MPLIFFLSSSEVPDLQLAAIGGFPRCCYRSSQRMSLGGGGGGGSAPYPGTVRSESLSTSQERGLSKSISSSEIKKKYIIINRNDDLVFETY